MIWIKNKLVNDGVITVIAGWVQEPAIRGNLMIPDMAGL